MLSGRTKLVVLGGLTAIALVIASSGDESSPESPTMADAAGATRLALSARSADMAAHEPTRPQAKSVSHEERVLQGEDELAERSEANRRALVAQHLVVLKRKAELAEKAGQGEQARRLRQRAQHLATLP